MVALDTNSKADTVYLALSIVSIATLATDVSQQRTALSTGATYAYEAASVRTAIDGTRTIEFRFDYTPGATGILVNHGTADGVSYTYRIETNGSSQILFKSGGTTLATIQLDAALSRTYVVFWSIRPDGGLALARSEFGVWDQTTTTWIREATTHVETLADPTWQLNLGGYGAGVNIFSGGMAALDFVRISERHHSAEEVYLDWIGSTTPDAVTAVRRTGPLPINDTTGIPEHGSFAGPALLIAGAATRENERRLLSPLINLRVSPNNLLDNNYAPATWVRTALGSTLFRWRIDLVWWRPVPRNCNRVRVRIHADHYQTTGGNLPVHLRVYSLDRLPNSKMLLNEQQKPIVYYFCQGQIDQSGTKPGVGVWVDLGELKIARSTVNRATFFAVGWSVNLDAGHVDEGGQVVRLNHVVAEPYALPFSGGQYGGGDLVLP